MADRISLLRQTLESDPDDAFARYALAMELRRAGHPREALESYAEVVRRTPGYVPAYQMAGQLHLELGDLAEARRWLERGVAVAKEAGNTKAAREMDDLLDEVSMQEG